MTRVSGESHERVKVATCCHFFPVSMERVAWLTLPAQMVREKLTALLLLCDVCNYVGNDFIWP